MISLGIDIGTTSICAVLYDLTEDKVSEVRTALAKRKGNA